MTSNARPITPEEITRYNTDRVIAQAIDLLLEMKVPLGVILDRLFTAAGAYAVAQIGSAKTAADFRAMADNVEKGAFLKLEPKGPGPAH